LPERSGGTYFIFYPEASLNQAIRDAIRPSLVFGLGGGLAAICLMFLIGQGLVGRIRALERRTRQIAAGDFSPMPLPKQKDELRDLAQSVNEMAARLAQLQEAVQRTERLRLLGQVSSGLAHQLRNAVTGAKLAVQIHASECPLKDDESLQVTLRQLSLMEANLRRFMNIGKVEPQALSHCNICKLIDEVLSLLQPQCRHAGIDVRYQRSESAIELEGDAGQLRDLFLNLLGNAIEAAGPKGMVEIRTSTASGDRRAAIVEIADSGPGPPLEIATRLFEPFVTGKPEGVGLGLAVSRQAAETHGGSIAWRREDNQTIFRVTLPLAA
jgi:signal transduction histidine kinase